MKCRLKTGSKLLEKLFYFSKYRINEITGEDEGVSNLITEHYIIMYRVHGAGKNEQVTFFPFGERGENLAVYNCSITIKNVE